jgi:Ribulose-5-phosphate 4-epimerase and related epimerases and aldolases
MDEKGFVNAVEGNISVFKDGLLYITPTGRSKAWLKEDMISVVDGQGNLIEGMPPSSEISMHMGAYTKRRDGSIGGVIHCHPTYLTCYAICRKPVECRSYAEHEGVFGTIPVAPYGTPGTDEIHAGIGTLFEQSDIVLLANHGVLAVGRSVEDALATVEAAEHSAQIYAACKLVGEPVSLTEDELELLQSIREERRRKKYENK